jgi:hypothetical protein
MGLFFPELKNFDAFGHTVRGGKKVSKVFDLEVEPQLSKFLFANMYNVT